MAEFDNEEYYMSGGDDNEEEDVVNDDNDIEDIDDESIEIIGDDEDADVVSMDDDDDDDDESEADNNSQSNIMMDDDDENDSSDYDESSDEEIENKVDDEFKEKFIHEIHPEEFYDDYNLVKIKSQVQRNEMNLIVDDNHTTLPLLTKYERARILGLRISQLNKGARPYIQINRTHIIDTHIIAEEELKEKRLPFIIMRPLPNGKKEYWKLEDLEIIEN